MKRKMIMMGGIGASVILVLVAFTSVVSAQTTKTSVDDVISEVQKQKSFNEKMSLFQQIKTSGISDLWDLLTFIFHFFMYLIVQFSLNHPPS